MLFAIQRYTIRMGSRCLRQCASFLSTSISEANDPHEFILNSDENLMVLRREGSKFLKVAILGAPNVGKSTLINQLTNRSLCPTSSKVHTTMHKAEAIYVDGDTQIVFMDTPGVVNSQEMKKYKLLDTFKKDPKVSIKDADVVAIIQDVANVYTRRQIDREVLNVVKDKETDIPLLLILNKIDRIKKKSMLLELTRALITNKDLPKIDDIFMISALHADGINDLRNYLLDSAKTKDWRYGDNTYTNQSNQQLIEETVRAKLLDGLPQEVPYKLKIKTEYLGTGEDGTIKAFLIIECPSERICTLLLRGKAHRIRTVALNAEKELRHAFRTPVILILSLKGKK